MTWTGGYTNVRYNFTVGPQSPYERALPPESFALKCRIKGEDIFLLQMSGAGRILIGNDRKSWWTKPGGVVWEVVPSDFGCRFPTREEASSIKRNLEGSPR
jgi:hypothetical protein